MAREVVRGEEGPRKTGMGQFMEMVDVDGNKVRVPVINQNDYSKPIPDQDGTIPEFVNISGAVQKMCIHNNPNGTVRVPSWDVLKGSQFRQYSEPAIAWGDTPKFMERKRLANGEYDPVYLLTEDQAIGLVTRLKNPDPGFGAFDRLKGFELNGKVQKVDKIGRPLASDRSEDRDKVVTAIAKKKLQLDISWDKQKKVLGIEG